MTRACQPLTSGTARSRNSVESRSAHLQRQSATRAGGLGQFDGPGDRSGVSGDHYLIRRIQVRRGHNLASRSFGQERVQLALWQLQQGRHRAHADGNRFLHVFATLAHQTDGIGKIERLSCHQRGVLTQTVPRDEIGLNVLVVEHAPSGHRNRQQRRLHVLGKLERLGRAFETKSGERESQSVVGLVENRAGG
jgi:hypothetical protein